MARHLTAQRAHRLLIYKEGGLYWRLSGGKARAEDRGTVCIDGRRYGAAALVWLMHHGTMPATRLEHINGDRNNWAIDNLKAVRKCQRR